MGGGGGDTARADSFLRAESGEDQVENLPSRCVGSWKVQGTKLVQV